MILSFETHSNSLTYNTILFTEIILFCSERGKQTANTEDLNEIRNGGYTGSSSRDKMVCEEGGYAAGGRKRSVPRRNDRPGVPIFVKFPDFPSDLDGAIKTEGLLLSNSGRKRVVKKLAEYLISCTL